MGRGCWQSNGALMAFGSAAIKLRVEPEQFNGAWRRGGEMLGGVRGVATHITSERVNRKVCESHCCMSAFIGIWLTLHVDDANPRPVHVKNGVV